MPKRLSEIVSYCDELLGVATITDYCPNGLQVEACDDVSQIVTAVTASDMAIDKAIELGAQCLLVHHGYFWKGESMPLVGMKGRRVAKLMRNGISLLAFHLPLDMHNTLGNNAQLGALLGWEGYPASSDGLIWMTHFEQSIEVQEVCHLLEHKLNRQPLWIDGGSPSIRRVAWCTGAAQSMLEKAALLGCDLFISGEISEPTVHAARELGVHYIAAGHHATERGGVRALGEHLAEHFGLSHEFVDIENPV